MPPPSEVIVADLFPPLLRELLALLAALSDEDWRRPTACAGWSVRDVALHLLGDDLGKLSRQRDRWRSGIAARTPAELVVLLDAHNQGWVQAARVMSPRVLRDLLEVTGTQICAYFDSLDPHAIGDVVSWAGPEPAPMWLDLAREYTERWHHQQHIRDAVGRPGRKDPRFFAPVIATFVRALPLTYRDTGADEGTAVVLTITGRSGGRWALRRQGAGWSLQTAGTDPATAEVTLDEDVAWRLFTKGLDREDASRKVEIVGDRRLGAKVLDAVAIIG